MPHMNYNYLQVTQNSKSLVRISLNRPEKRNALNLALMQELCTVFASFENDPHLRVVQLFGRGNTFCAGLDLSESILPENAQKMATAISNVFKAIYNSSLVTVAVLEGDALAGGAGLVAACDFAVAASSTNIGFPEIHRGLVAALVAALLCRQIGMRDVRHLLLTGALVSAKQALEMRLITHVAAPEQVENVLDQLTAHVMRGSPNALKETKLLLQKLNPKDFASDIEIALSTYNQVRLSKDAKEGMQAFLEKRPPSWSL